MKIRHRATVAPFDYSGGRINIHLAYREEQKEQEEQEEQEEMEEDHRGIDRALVLA